MAYESWAGGKISSEDTPSSRSPRGGYIPLADIPNAPKGVEMPLAKYQAIPSIRHEYVSTDLDMASRAQKLMQKPLPSDFEEAGNIRTASAEKGQAAWGKAVESGGKEVGSALGTFGNALARLQGEAVKSANETATSRYDQLETLHKQKIDAVMKTKPFDQWGPEIEKLNKDFQAQAATGFGASSPVTRDRINRRASTVGQWTKTHGETEAAVQSLNNDREFHVNSIKENRQNGNAADNGDHYRYLKERGYLSDDEVKLEKQKDADVESQGNFKIAEVNNPRAAKDEAKKVMDGGTSKDFPHLNKANAANHYVEAQNATRVKDQETVTDLSNAFTMGRTTDPAEIERLARARGLPDEDVIKLRNSIKEGAEKAKKDADANIKSDPAAIVATRKLIAEYDGNADADGVKFKEAQYFINSHIETELRDHFMGKLKAKTPEANQKKAPEQLVRDREAESLGKEIHALGEKGLQFTDDTERTLFHKAQKKLKDGQELDAKEMAVWRKGNQWIDDKLNEVDAAVTKEPDFAPGDLRTKIRKDMAPEIQKNIGTSNPAAPPPRATLNPTAPTREQIAAAPGVTPSEWVATAPRDLGAGGRGGSAAFQQAFVSGGERSDAEATAYTKHEPGGNQVKSREGPLFTMEKYARGTVPYVSVSMDDKSEFQGKYILYSAHPNVVFKVEDRGGAFVGKGNSRIDIAYDNRAMETGYKSHGTIKEISEEEALKISGSSRRGVAGLNKQRGDMGTLAGTDQQKIVSLKPEAQGPISSFVSAAKSWGEKNGYEVSIAEGYRSPERQAELYAQGRTKPGNIVTNAKPGQSNHQSGRAIDLVVTKNGKVVDDERVWAQLGKIGQSMGLEWGGTWKSIHDPEHFQVNG